MCSFFSLVSILSVLSCIKFGWINILGTRAQVSFTVINATVDKWMAGCQCRRIGMRLATIRSVAENDNATNVCGSNTLSPSICWLGATDQNDTVETSQSDRRFTWDTDNNPIPTNNSEATYANWDRGGTFNQEPNNSGGKDEACVIIKVNTRKWNDKACTDIAKPLCEDRGGVAPTNCSLPPSPLPSSPPSHHPSKQPSMNPSKHPSSRPSENPTTRPSANPSNRPSAHPSLQPTKQRFSTNTSQPTFTTTQTIIQAENTGQSSNILGMPLTAVVGGVGLVIILILLCWIWWLKKSKQEDRKLTDEGVQKEIEDGEVRFQHDNLGKKPLSPFYTNRKETRERLEGEGSMSLEGETEMTTGNDYVTNTQTEMYQATTTQTEAHQMTSARRSSTSSI